MGFEIGFVWPDLFGYVHEIQSDYNAERDGSIHQHKPSLFFKHIDDISIKYALIRLSLNKIITILNNISSKFIRKGFSDLPPWNDTRYNLVKGVKNG